MYNIPQTLTSKRAMFQTMYLFFVTVLIKNFFFGKSDLVTVRNEVRVFFFEFE